MPSERQIAANRHNSKKGTGPKTAEGEAVSRFNAIHHGFTVKHNTLPFDNNAEFHAIRDEFLAEHQPATPTEFVQVEQMVTLAIARGSSSGWPPAGSYRPISPWSGKNTSPNRVSRPHSLC